MSSRKLDPFRQTPRLALAALAVLLCGARDVPPAHSEQSDAELSAKLSGYIDCINTHRNWTYQSRQRYFSWLKSPEKGPTGREDIVYGIYALRDPQDCAKAIAAASDMPPDNQELEAAARAWGDALIALEALVAQAERYYQLEDYKDDGMQRGKEMHAPLVAAFGAFEAADVEYYDRVAAQQDAMAARRLHRLSEDPARRTEFLLASVLDRAKALANAMELVGTDDFDRERYADLVQQYQGAYDALESYGKQHPDAEPDALRPGSWFLRSALDFLKATKSLARRERDGMRFDTGEQMLIDANAPEMVEGHPAQALDKYNDLVERANRDLN